MLIQRLRSLVENLEIFVIRVNAAVIASGGFAGNAEFGQVLEGRGHGRHAEFQFLTSTGNREDRLGLEQPVSAQGAVDWAQRRGFSRLPRNGAERGDQSTHVAWQLNKFQFPADELKDEGLSFNCEAEY